MNWANWIRVTMNEVASKWDGFSEVAQYADEFAEWFDKCGAALMRAFAEKAMRNPPSEEWVWAYLEGQFKAAREPWRVVKNVYIAWLVWRGYLTTYRANKLAGGTAGYYEWLKRIRMLNCS